eukprot:1164085-Amphidinium_carterae.1
MTSSQPTSSTPMGVTSAATSIQRGHPAHPIIAAVCLGQVRHRLAHDQRRAIYAVDCFHNYLSQSEPLEQAVRSLQAATMITTASSSPTTSSWIQDYIVSFIHSFNQIIEFIHEASAHIDMPQIMHYAEFMPELQIVSVGHCT